MVDMYMKTCHHACIIIIDMLSYVMTMMMMRTAINIPTRYWTFHTSQSPILQWRVPELVKLNPLSELAPRFYQLPWKSMGNIVENQVDCQIEAEHILRFSSSVVWEKNPIITRLRSFTNQTRKNIINRAYKLFAWRN